MGEKAQRAGETLRRMGKSLRQTGETIHNGGGKEYERGGNRRLMRKIKRESVKSNEMTVSVPLRCR